MRYFAIQLHYNGNMTALHLLNVWNNGCRVGPKPTARTFTLLYVLELEVVSY